MFSYYGSKSKIVHLYPPPKYGKIIEPFAGSARYSLKYWDREILLVDKYDVIVRIWKWLQLCSKNDILKLPNLPAGGDLKKCGLSDDELLFCGMIAGVSATSPRFKVSPFSAEQNGNRNRLKIIANNLHKISHWEIKLGDYTEIENQEATWFIDPPYQFGGQAYVENSIDYSHLAKWSTGRHGQIIICENTKADWLNFNPILKTRGSSNIKSIEAIWSNIPTNYDHVQIEMAL